MISLYLFDGFMIGSAWYADIPLAAKIGLIIVAAGWATLQYTLFDKGNYAKKFQRDGHNINFFEFLIIYFGWMAIPAILGFIVWFVLQKIL